MTENSPGWSSSRIGYFDLTWHCLRNQGDFTYIIWGLWSQWALNHTQNMRPKRVCLFKLRECCWRWRHFESAGPPTCQKCTIHLSFLTPSLGLENWSKLLARQLICYPLRVRVGQISGLWKYLVWSGQWFVGVAPSSATPTNQSEGQSNLSHIPEIRITATLSG